MKYSDLYQFAKANGIDYSTIRNRWNKGDRGERLTRPPDAAFRNVGGAKLLSRNESVRLAMKTTRAEQLEAIQEIFNRLKPRAE